MDKNRFNNILKEEKICEVFYYDNPIWIQEFNNNTAKIGFLNGNNDMEVSIEDLHEKC